MLHQWLLLHTDFRLKTQWAIKVHEDSSGSWNPMCGFIFCLSIGRMLGPNNGNMRPVKYHRRWCAMITLWREEESIANVVAKTGYPFKFIRWYLKYFYGATVNKMVCIQSPFEGYWPSWCHFRSSVNDVFNTAELRLFSKTHTMMVSLLALNKSHFV